MLEDERIVLPDGRTLGYAIYGISKPAVEAQEPPPTVIYFHGFPGSQFEGRTFHEGAARHGIRLVAISRPGMGESTYQPDRTLLSIADDVLRLADHLGAARFAVVGLSGGGPYALACAHAIPAARLRGAIVLSGAYPAKLGMRGVELSERLLFTVAPHLKIRWVARVLDAAMGVHARDTSRPEAFARAVADYSRSPGDRAALAADDGRLLAVFVDSARGAFRAGADGAAWEARLFGSPWGFELADLHPEPGRVVLWHGAKDDLIPLRMAEKAAPLIPGAKFIVEQDASHLGLCTSRMDQIMTTVLEMLTS